jgi:hypothetical protein
MPALRRVVQPPRERAAGRGESASRTPPITRAAVTLPAPVPLLQTPMLQTPVLQTPMLQGPMQTAAAMQPVDTAPDALTRAVGRMVGEDLAGVPVWHDDASRAAAAQLGARAFTAGGAIHMRADHETPGDRRTTSLLAHELTHVAQQRRAPLSIASETSPQGRRMEAQARAVEQRVAHHGTATTPPWRSAGHAPATQSRRSHPAAAVTPAPGVQRARVDDVADAGFGEADNGTAIEKLDLDDLARRLYARLRRQLRDELLLDRERVGLGAGRW